MATELTGIRAIGKVDDHHGGQPPACATATSTSFQEILAQQFAGRKEVKFSGHAQQRLQRRQVQLGEDDVAKLERAIDRAAEKGVKESLVLMDELALIVSVKNRTVITAMPSEQAKQGVFTNIDGVVIA